MNTTDLLDLEDRVLDKAVKYLLAALEDTKIPLVSGVSIAATLLTIRDANIEHDCLRFLLAIITSEAADQTLKLYAAQAIVAHRVERLGRK